MQTYKRASPGAKKKKKKKKKKKELGKNQSNLQNILELEIECNVTLTNMHL